MSSPVVLLNVLIFYLADACLLFAAVFFIWSFKTKPAKTGSVDIIAVEFVFCFQQKK